MIKTGLFILLCAGLLAVISAVGTVQLPFDGSIYKQDISEVLSQELGHTATIDGPLKLQASLNHGLELTLSDVSIINPIWARQKKMASIGQVQLGIRLLPLMQQKLAIKSLTIDRADIDLEKGQGNDRNYAPPRRELIESGSVKAQVQDFEIINSRAVLVDRDGVIAKVYIDAFSFGPTLNRTRLHFIGRYNDIPIKLNLAGGVLAHFLQNNWPFVADVLYGNYRFQAEGLISENIKHADIRQYLLIKGTTQIHGKMEIMWDGLRPFLRGTVVSDRLDPADFDFIGPFLDQKNNHIQEGYQFNTKPFDLRLLKIADAKLGIAIDALPINRILLTQITATLGLSDGELLLAPVRSVLAKSTVDSQFMLNAASVPTEAALIFYAPDLDLSELLPLGGAEIFLAGKSDINVSLSSFGNSLHELAGNAKGQINLIAAGGMITDDIQDRIASTLTDILTAGTGGSVHSNMKCLVTHFDVAKGIAVSNKLFVDTGVMMMTGHGGFNMHNETIDIFLQAKTDGSVDVGGLLPRMHIGGGLFSPTLSPDTSAIVPNISNIIANPVGEIAENNTSVSQDTVLDVDQKFCADILDRQSPLLSGVDDQGGLVQKWAAQIRDQLKAFTGKYLGANNQ